MTIFKKHFTSFLLGTALVSTIGSGVARAQDATDAYRNRDKIGLNLAGVRDYSTEMAFADIFKTSRVWISQKDGEKWGKGPELKLRPDGYPATLEPGARADTPMLTFGETPVPQGDYTLLYEGQGAIELWPGNVKVVSSAPGKIVFQPGAKKADLFLRLTQTDAADPVRNIRVYWPGQAEPKSPFNPKFQEYLRPFGAFRFMDWGATNGNTLAKWSERPLPTDSRYSTDKGVPIETMIELANAQDADAWFTIPHLADDEFMREYAKLVKAKLKPGLTAYVEYSNEVWNNQFAQTKYAQKRGQELGLSDKNWEAGWYFYAQRTGEMGRIWREVFGEQAKDRLVVVAAAQAGNPFVAKQILEYKDTAKIVDALAVAPYFGNQFGDKKTMDEVSGWTVDQLMNKLQEEVRGDNKTKRIGQHAELAKQHGLKLVAYEGGQHLVGHGGAENNAKLMELFHAANRDPRMGQLYQEHLTNWFAAGGDLYAIFSSVSSPSKWGSWGLTEYLGQPASEAPKYQAVLAFAKEGEVPARK